MIVKWNCHSIRTVQGSPSPYKQFTRTLLNQQEQDGEFPELRQVFFVIQTLGKLVLVQVVCSITGFVNFLLQLFLDRNSEFFVDTLPGWLLRQAVLVITKKEIMNAKIAVSDRKLRCTQIAQILVLVSHSTEYFLRDTSPILLIFLEGIRQMYTLYWVKIKRILYLPEVRK